MGTISARAVINRAKRIIQDQTGVRWPNDELLQWLNSGQREIVSLRPDAGAITETRQLVAGTKQSVPDSSIRVLDIIRNMGLDGSTPGDVVTYVTRNILDTQLRGWHYSTPSPTAVHWTYDDREPRTFYVFPPQPATGRGSIDIIHSECPEPCTLAGVALDDGVGTTIASADSLIRIDDIYEPSLVDYVVFRSYNKNQEYVQQGVDMKFWQKFVTGLGLKMQVDARFSAMNNAPPNLNNNVPRSTGAFGS